MFKVHPYKWTTIGEMEHLDAATLEEFLAFNKKFYVPNNAVLVIAGQFDKAQAKEWVVGTSALKASAGFTRLGPSLVVVAGYGVAFYLLSLTLRHIPAGVAYAAWSGLGIVLIAAVGWLFYGQRLDAPALIGMALIVVGVLLMNLSSTSAGH